MRLLVGAGGHAKVLIEMLELSGKHFDAYVDSSRCDRLDATWVKKDDEADTLEVGSFILGLGGYKPEQLERRLQLYRAYREKGWDAPPMIHPSATVSESSVIGEGSCVLAGAVVQPDAVIGEAVIVNTGAVIEHDSQIGDGTHVAPGATVLGDCVVGAGCMIGSGSVILQGAKVPDRTLVKALERFPV